MSPDGRYVAPAGRYHLPHPETVATTYLIRPPIGSYEKRWHRQGPNSPRPNLPNKPRPFAVQQQQPQDNNQHYPHLVHLERLADFRQTQNGIFPDYYHPFYVPQVIKGIFSHHNDPFLNKKTARFYYGDYIEPGTIRLAKENLLG